MDIFILVVLFIYGACFGSFYGVVGDRLSNNLSIVKPHAVKNYLFFILLLRF